MVEDETLDALAHRVTGMVKADAVVASYARSLWETTDADPLVGLTFDQGQIWDALCDALAAAEEWRR